MVKAFNDYRGIPRRATLLIYAGILPALSFGMLYNDLSYFLPDVQGISTTFMGLVLTVMGLSMVISSIPMGIAADRYGKKRMLIIGNVVASLVIAMFALTTNLALLFMAAVLEGVSEAAFSSSSSALLADLAGDEKRTVAFSLSGFLTSIASGLGTFVIPLVVVLEDLGFSNKEGHVILYVIVAIMGLSSTLLILKLGKITPLQKGGGFKSFLPNKSKKVLFRYILSNSMIAVGAGLFVPIMSHWFSLRYGVPDSISVPVLGVSSILIGVSSLAAPYLARRVGIIRAIVATQGISMVFMLATPLSPEFYSASAVYTLRSFLMNMAGPLQQSMIMGLVSPDERGAASGVSSALWRLPNSFTVIIGTLLLSEGQLAEPFYLAALFYAISITMFWFFFRNVRMPEEKNVVKQDQ